MIRRFITLFSLYSASLMAMALQEAPDILPTKIRSIIATVQETGTGTIWQVNVTEKNAAVGDTITTTIENHTVEGKVVAIIIKHNG